MTDTAPVLTRPAAHVARIELNRPAGANRIEASDLPALHALLDQCEAEPALHVLVLAARGRHFCSGFDLRALLAQAASGESGAASGDGGFEALANRLEATRLLTIAAINGPVVGGGTDLALACDLRVGAPEATMQMPAAQFGLPLYSGALQRYVTRLGVNHAKRLVFTAARLEAQEMLAIGFLSQIVPQAELSGRCLALAGDIAALPPGPLAAMKLALNAAAIGEGNSAQVREALRSAFDGAHIRDRLEALRARRQR